MEQDAVCNELLNLRARDDSAPVIKLNPPYNLLVDLDKVSHGRDPRILLELFKYICENPESSDRLLVRLRKEPKARTVQIENLVY